MRLLLLLLLERSLCCLAKECVPPTIGIEPIVLVHGGAGNIADENLASVKDGVKSAARVGYSMLRSSGKVLDAVQEAVRVMEADPQFNSGYGSVLTWEGKVEMDAAIMNGADLNAGCVSIVRDIYHPVDLARHVMDRTRHKYLAGEGAMVFACEEGFDILKEGELVTYKAVQALAEYKKSLNDTCCHCSNTQRVEETIGGFTSNCNFLKSLCEDFGPPGTVGAVAIDECGNVAAATSTGGITGKMPGRIGDSSILGGGTYADNEAGAISATGHGETIMRYNLASRVLGLIRHESMTAQEATIRSLEEMTERFNQTAGVISVDTCGNIGIYFTSKRMSWAYQRGDELHYGADKNEDNVEIMGEPRLKTFQELCIALDPC